MITWGETSQSTQLSNILKLVFIPNSSVSESVNHVKLSVWQGFFVVRIPVTMALPWYIVNGVL